MYAYILIYRERDHCGGPLHGISPRRIVVVSSCRCEPLRAGCCGVCVCVWGGGSGRGLPEEERINPSP